VTQIVSFISSLIMTRLLTPDMYGVMVIATMVVVVLQMLSDIGLRQNIVQSRRGNDPAFLDTAWVVQIVRGLILWGIASILGLTVYIANTHRLLPSNSTYSSPELPWLIVVCAFTAVLQGLQSTKSSTADRSFDQRGLVRLELVAQVTGLTVQVIVAFITRSIWALPVGWIVSAAIVTIFTHTWLPGHANHFRVESGALRELVAFGKWIVASSSLFVLAVNGDRILLGGLVEPEILGCYSVAIMIVAAVEGLLGKLAMSVALPALSETVRSEPANLRSVYYKMTLPTDLGLLFMAGVLFSFGKILIGILYDSRYAAAGDMLEILAVSLIAARYAVAHQLYLAMGVPRYLTAINLVRMVTLYTSLPLAYNYAGLGAAIWAISLHTIATLPVVYWVNVRLKIFDIRREVIVLIALPMGFITGNALKFLV
jgi:O-antigen/teichoic acid export membrane protein